jgi:hypothetical protein
MSPAALLARPRGTPSAPHPLRCAARSEEVRPRTIITRSLDEIARFLEPQSGKIVLKPLTGCGRQDVHLVNETADDLGQIVEAMTRPTATIRGCCPGTRASRHAASPSATEPATAILLDSTIHPAAMPAGPTADRPGCRW